MSFSAIIKSFLFLCILFVMLYVGMNNTDRIDFSFPVASKEKIHAPAAIIFFGLFAVGVIGGTLLHSNSKKSAPAKAK